jgi:uncharacterized integral membrane protein (TIGR00697 family)
MKNYRYLDLITALFVTVLLVSNIAAVKLLHLGPFSFDGGTILFPLSYIFGDVLTEVYGYQRSRRVIWIGFGCLALMAVTLAVVQALPADSFWSYPDNGLLTPEATQSAFNALLGQAPRIVLASLIAYWAGEFSNSYLLAKLKLRTQGRFLWLRTISSTLLGQGIDTVFFVFIAFWGVLPNEIIGIMLISNYIFKVAVEIVFTPLTYWLVNSLKEAEGEDYFDHHTDFNPLKVG